MDDEEYKNDGLDKNHENVNILQSFGFSETNIDAAWLLMKKNDKHKMIVPDHGPLFIETMLDYLNKYNKQN